MTGETRGSWIRAIGWLLVAVVGWLLFFASIANADLCTPGSGPPGFFGRIRQRIRSTPQPAVQPAPSQPMPAAAPLPLQPQATPIVGRPPAQQATAGASIYSAELESARQTIDQLERDLADCRDACASWSNRAEGLANDVALERRARATLEEDFQRAKAAMTVGSGPPHVTGVPDVGGPAGKTTAAGDPWWWRWAPTAVGLALGALGVGAPAYMKWGWRGYKVVSRRRRRRRDAGEASHDDPFPE